jgi:uncharacterized membrane protein
MSAIVESVEIGRSPQEVFAYLDDWERHSEWQEQLVSVKVETEGPIGVGSRIVETRRVPGGPRQFTSEITEHEPPRRLAFRVTEGPVRPHGTVVVEPVGEGARARVTLELDFQGHGFGKLIAPLARRDARKRVPRAQAKLKERLESRA